MQITVAICTWNRAKLLDQTLTEMRKLRIPFGVEWELLVVNNNCSDETDVVVARHQPYLPLRLLHETKQGHSHARNCAISAAKGQLLIWTDDDVLVDPDWLTHYVQVSRDWPDISYFGGTVEGWFESEPPRWMRRHLKELNGLFVITYRENDIRPLNPGEGVMGANMAFRTEILRRNPFDTTLGRSRSVIIGADDTEIQQRLRGLGHQGLWVGPARVRHFIPSSRLTTDYAGRWYRGAGRTVVRQNELGATKLLLGVPRWVLREYAITSILSYCLAPLKGPRWFDAFRKSSTLRGIIDEYRERRAINSQPSH
jgi:glycosyltransferase involved in cell wall biosynthesis